MIHQIDQGDLINFVSDQKILYASDKIFRFYVCIDKSEKVYFQIVEMKFHSLLLTTYKKDEAISYWNQL